MSGQCSGCRLPEGVATILETKTSGHSPSNKLRMKDESTGTMDWNSRTRDKSTKSIECMQIVVLIDTRKARDSSSNNRLRRFNESVTVNLTRIE